MKYELMVLAKPLTNEDIRDKVISKIEKKVMTSQGKFSISDFIGKRLLSYPIKKFKEGVYVLCDVEVSESNVSELRQTISLIPEVLRFLMIRKDNV